MNGNGNETDSTSRGVYIKERPREGKSVRELRHLFLSLLLRSSLFLTLSSVRTTAANRMHDKTAGLPSAIHHVLISSARETTDARAGACEIWISRS